MEPTAPSRSAVSGHQSSIARYILVSHDDSGPLGTSDQLGFQSFPSVHCIILSGYRTLIVDVRLAYYGFLL